MPKKVKTEIEEQIRGDSISPPQQQLHQQQTQYQQYSDNAYLPPQSQHQHRRHPESNLREGTRFESGDQQSQSQQQLNPQSPSNQTYATPLAPELPRPSIGKSQGAFVNSPGAYMPFAPMLHPPTVSQHYPTPLPVGGQKPAGQTQSPLAPPPVPSMINSGNITSTVSIGSNSSSIASPIGLSGFKGRMRVSKACDRCRTQKIKCSGTHPCNTCVKHKKECTFSTNYHPNTAGSTTTIQSNGKPVSEYPLNKRQKLSMINVEPFGLPTMDRTHDKEYIAHLENRVQYLERLLTSNMSHTFREPRISEPENQQVEETLFASSSKWRFSRRHQNLLLVELCRSMYSNLSEDSKKLVTVPRTQYFGWNMSGVHYVNSEELPPVPDFDNSPELVTDELIDFYFRELNSLFAILHETVFREQYQAYYMLLKEQQLENSDDRDSKTNQTRLFSAILYLVYALAIRFSEFQKPKGPNIEMLELESKLFKYGYKVISILSFEWESFELIQGWILIGLYLRVTHRQTSSSHAFDSAIVMTKSMGLGFEETNPKMLACTAYERVKAKRIFWCVYTFDRIFGLLTGRYCGIREEDFDRKFPSYDDFKLDTFKDDWMTFPAMALLHVARIANFVHTAPNDNPDLIKYQQINTELAKLHDWFNSNGFRNDLLFNKDDDKISSLVKAQVKLHYYDLVLCIHGKILFNYIGRRITSHGLKLEMVLDASTGVLEVLDKVNKAGLLYTPWYSTLLLLFNVGVNALTLINGGIFVVQARDLLKNTIRLFTILRKSPIRNDQGKLVFRERFKMVRECIWALKMANRILTLRIQEDMTALNNIGVDHGSSEVNKQTFNQLGVDLSTMTKKINQSNEFNKVFEKQLHRNDDDDDEEEEETTRRPREVRTPLSPNLAEHQTPSSVTSMDNNSAFGGVNSGDPIDLYAKNDVNDLLGNIQWFDQWMDFNYDFGE
ncbi:putative transcriptional regulatory protein STB4 [Spathaspora sp. JA1]|nr:putative transcriptional regulatory protein STB4 [Spathaspora sp. JA1]